MPEVSVFNIQNQNISVKDSTARTAAASAQSTAEKAQSTASNAASQASSAASAASAAQSAAKAAQSAAEAAQAEIAKIAELSRIEITYSSGTEAITITTVDHETT